MQLMVVLAILGSITSSCMSSDQCQQGSWCVASKCVGCSTTPRWERGPFVEVYGSCCWMGNRRREMTVSPWCQGLPTENNTMAACRQLSNDHWSINNANHTVLPGLVDGFCDSGPELLDKYTAVATREPIGKKACLFWTRAFLVAASGVHIGGILTSGSYGRDPEDNKAE